MNADATPAHDHDLGLAESHLQYPLFNEIIDNDIHHCGEIIYYAAGVFAALSEDNVIGHNAIHDTPHHGINLGSSGMSRNIVEYNDFHRTCRRTGDTGAINCWGDAQPRTASRQGHIIRFNRIVDPGGNGLYLDNYTSNCYVFGNLIVGAQSLGIHIHGGKNNVLENNVIVGARDAVGFADFVSTRTPEMVNFCLGNRFCHNIVADCKRSVLWHYTRLWPLRSVSQSDDNLIFHSADGSAYLDSRRAEGLEANSLAADPLFVDPARGDYRLKPESPALGAGLPVDRLQPDRAEKVGRKCSTPPTSVPGGEDVIGWHVPEIGWHVPEPRRRAWWGWGGRDLPRPATPFAGAQGRATRRRTVAD